MTSAKKPLTTDFFLAKKWEHVFGDDYGNWRRERWLKSNPKTRTFLDHVLPLGRIAGEKRLLPHQAEALQRIIYTFEHTMLRADPLLVTLATGTGKTVLMAAVMAYLACQGDIANTFLLLCPNTIVRDRLRRDFESLAVFAEFDFFPPGFQSQKANLRCSVVEGFASLSNIRGFNVLVANRHQFQRGYAGGNDHLTFIHQEGGKVAVFNDEAHNTRGTEYTRTLKTLADQTSFRLDVTATPDRADNLRPQSHEIYSLSVVEAITGLYGQNPYIDPTFSNYPPLIKDVVVNRPSMKTMGAVNVHDLIFRDQFSGQELKVREIDWEELPRKKSLQLVMDPGGMKLQLTLAIQALVRKKEIARDRYKPLLFVIAPSIYGAKQAVEMMKKEFRLNPLLVVDDESEYEKKELRDAAANLGDPKSPYDSVVSVYMLREGWDVPEVSVICLLRGFGSPLFAHQVLGRGLRLVRRNGLQNERSIQELTVIDHPALDLNYLWDEIDAQVEEDGQIIRPREIDRTTPELPGGDEDEKKLEQLVIRSDILALLKVPDPLTIGSISTQRALEILEQSLQCLRDVIPEQQLMFVSATAGGIETIRPQRAKEHVHGEIKVTAIPERTIDRDKAQGELNKSLMEWAKHLCETYEPLVTHDTVVYKALVASFERFFFAGQQVTEVGPGVLFGAITVIAQVREAVGFEMNHRIYGEELLKNG